jgi:hypothetical protein
VTVHAGDADIRRLELSTLRNFRKYAHGEVPGTDSLWHWLALGQHRGLPTRMIDWTYSPLVALHFATEDTAAYHDDGIVWCVNFVEANERLPVQLRRILDRECSDTFTVDMLAEIGSLREFDTLSADPFVVFVEPPAMDRRILNQFALFSLMSNPNAVLHDWMRQHPDLCRSVRIPASMKWEVCDKLDHFEHQRACAVPGPRRLEPPAGALLHAREDGRTAERRVQAKRLTTPRVAPLRPWKLSAARSFLISGAVRDRARACLP